MKLTYLLNRNLFSALRIYPQCYFSTTSRTNLFFESDRKGGYYKDRPKHSKWELIKLGWKELKHEFKLLKQEAIEKIDSDPMIFATPGEIDKQWELRKAEHLDNWVTTSDSDVGEGFSTCSLTINNYGYGHFCGVLDPTVPKDGRVKRAGYCSVRTIKGRKSFKRTSFKDWCSYTHIVLKVRGDGRSYMLNIATEGYYDQMWNDMYQYVLYTRGGPYWQISKIPFSKFFFSNKGRIQDRQGPISLDCVTHFGITSSDKISGPFSLEIDYIGVLYDPTHTEEFAYEMYETPRNIAAN